MSKNLLMCATPLQMLIAERIIRIYPHEDFKLLLLVLSDNDKYRYYYNRISSLCSGSIYHVPERGLKGIFKLLKNLKKNRMLIGYDKIYIASINESYFQYIISFNSKAQVFTFDDGTANIFSNSIYFKNENINIYKRICRGLLGLNIYTEHVRSLSKLHYTIYFDMPNIVDNTKYLELFDDTGSKKLKSSNKTIKIYLGQPLSDKFSDKYIASILDKLGVTHYFPHPREKTFPNGDFQIIETPLIFEDYIINYLELNDEIFIEVFSFISGALINLSSFNRVRTVYIYNYKLYEEYKSFYDLVQKKFNIPLIHP
ncbi:glycosyltransferase family 52 [Psychrobacter phenylpyruvicus]|nr:glycosyltransferase family 52 [Psychrobacter phenylpyruvicus]